MAGAGGPIVGEARRAAAQGYPGPRRPQLTAPQSRPATTMALAMASGSVNQTSWLPEHST
jgi:hypothetical protein